MTHLIEPQIYERLESSYETVCKTESIGGREWKLHQLRNLDSTIDLVFEILLETGTSQLLDPLCPYFGVPWPAGRALAEKLAQLWQEAPIPTGSGMLELGCGLALPSLLSSIAFETETFATDFHPHVEGFLRKNLQENRKREGLNLRYECMDWRESTALLRRIRIWKSERQIERLHTVCASDILYEAQQVGVVADLWQVLREKEQPTTFFLSDPRRPYLAPFKAALRERGFPEPELREMTFRTDDQPQLGEVLIYRL